MERRKLGTSDLHVSRLCLGSMTWGTQNSEAEGHAQIDRAVDAGINFIDTAEMYPTTPMSPETQGRTEEIIGTWISQPGNRDRVLIASKITGAGGTVREGRGIHPDTLVEAVDNSLRRLQVDTIDLYQLHWPNRGSYHFRKNWDYDPSGQDPAAVEADMTEVLETLDTLVKAGKIRHVGLSNETCWGSATWLRLARETGGPRMVSIQNEYSMMWRLFDTDMAELALNEHLDLLAFSPLAAGMLTGKYSNGAMPEGSRATINDTLGGRLTERAHLAVDAYAAIARKHGLELVQMALAWAMQRPFMGSVIFGATTFDQLELALGAADLQLSPEIRTEIDAAHRLHALPY